MSKGYQDIVIHGDGHAYHVRVCVECGVMLWDPSDKQRHTHESTHTTVRDHMEERRCSEHGILYHRHNRVSDTGCRGQQMMRLTDQEREVVPVDDPLTPAEWTIVHGALGIATPTLAEVHGVEVVRSVRAQVRTHQVALEKQRRESDKLQQAWEAYQYAVAHYGHDSTEYAQARFTWDRVSEARSGYVPSFGDRGRP